MFGIGGIIAGIIFFLIGGFLVFFFSMAQQHQSVPDAGNFQLTAIVLGFIFFVVGFVLVFL